MPRPCNCGRVRPGPYTTDQCRRCWLAENSPRHQELWGVQPAGRLRRFLAALARHAKDRFRRVSEAEYERRLGVCRGCEHYLDAYPGGRCARCGCGLAGAVFSKARARSETCPVGKW